MRCSRRRPRRSFLRRPRTRAGTKGSRPTPSRSASRCQMEGFRPRQPRGLQLSSEVPWPGVRTLSMHGKHKRHRGSALKVLVIALGVFVVIGSGSAYAAYRYDHSTSETIMPGVKVAGINLGDKTRAEALQLLEGRADERLSGPRVVTAAGNEWTVTPKALGVTADIEGAVARAVAVGDDLSFVPRLYHRLWDEPVQGASFKIGFSYDQG